MFSSARMHLGTFEFSVIELSVLPISYCVRNLDTRKSSGNDLHAFLMLQ